MTKCWLCGTTYENSWHVCPADLGKRLTEDFAEIFEDDKREPDTTISDALREYEE